MKHFAVLVAMLNSCAMGQDISFVKEDITFRLDKDHFIVDGNYWFANPSDNEVARLIYYPFPATEARSVDSVDIFDITQGVQPLILNSTDGGFNFVLRIAAHDTSLCHIAYRQRISGDSAMYILRSTKAWNRPLDYAEYKLIPDESIEVVRVSYDADKVYNIEGKKIYLWRRISFMPERDFVVHFKVK